MKDSSVDSCIADSKVVGQCNIAKGKAEDEHELLI